MKISAERLKQIVQEELAVGIVAPEQAEDGKRTRDPDGYEGRMAKQNLWKMANYAKELHDMIADDENLEPWVEEKIAVASFMMDSVAHYLEYEKERSHESAEGEMGHVDFPAEEEEPVGIEVTGTGVPEEDEEEYEFDLEPEGGDEEEEHGEERDEEGEEEEEEDR